VRSPIAWRNLGRVRKCWTSARATGSTCCLGPSSRRDGVRLWRRNDRRATPTLPRDNAPGATNVEFLKGHDRGHPAAGWIGGRGDQQLRDQPVGRQPEDDLRDVLGTEPNPTPIQRGGVGSEPPKVAVSSPRDRQFSVLPSRLPSEAFSGLVGLWERRLPPGRIPVGLARFELATP
jgi:hypothetical protein